MKNTSNSYLKTLIGYINDQTQEMYKLDVDRQKLLGSFIDYQYRGSCSKTVLEIGETGAMHS